MLPIGKLDFSDGALLSLEENGQVLPSLNTKRSPCMTPDVATKRPCQPPEARGLRVADRGKNPIMDGNSEPSMLIAAVVQIHVGQMADLRKETSDEGHDEH